MTTGNRVADYLEPRHIVIATDYDVWPGQMMTAEEIKRANGDAYIFAIQIENKPTELVLNDDLVDYLADHDDVNAHVIMMEL